MGMRDLRGVNNVDLWIYGELSFMGKDRGCYLFGIRKQSF